jgi:hypothetical protein
LASSAAFPASPELGTPEVEELLRRNLSSFVGDSAAIEIPAAVLARIVDFMDYEERLEDYNRLFTFCVKY